MTDGRKISLLCSALFFAAASGLLTACGGGDGSPAATTDSNSDRFAKVNIVYRAAVAPNTAIQNAFPQCAETVRTTRVQASWQSFLPIAMSVNGTNSWKTVYNDVPVNRLLSVRINDANVCDLSPTATATMNIFANGVELTNIVDTPGIGTESGLSFTVDQNGNVTP